MKKIMILAATLAAFTCSPMQAASLRFDELSPNIFALFLEGETDNGNFDTIDVNVQVNGGTLFVNPDPLGAVNFIPRPLGDTATFVNILLSTPPALGGYGFSILGLEVTDTQVSFAGGPLGEVIDTESAPNVGQDGLFLANFLMEGRSARTTVHLISGGNVISTLSYVFPLTIPEPTTMVLAAIATLGMSVARRRPGCLKL